MKRLVLLSAAIALSGCTAVAQSSAPSVAAQSLNIPTRISRGFFEEPVNGRIAISRDGEARPFAELESPVRWRDEPTTLPPPQAGYLADFRDHPGCADYVSLPGVSYCFTVSPDVSSLDVTGAKTHAEGLTGLVAAQLERERSYSCRDPVQRLHFDTATQEGGNALTIVYRGDAGCPGESPVPLAVTLQFQLA